MGKNFRASGWLSAVILLASVQADAVTLSFHCGTEANRSCEQAVHAVGAVIDERLREQVLSATGSGGLYRLKDLLLVPRPGTNPATNEFDFQETQAPSPEVCSLNGNRFNEQTPERDINHLERSCGTPDTIDCRTSTKQELRAQLLVGTGVRENSHLQGAFLESLDCFSREILAEVRTSREIQLPGTEETNACLVLVDRYIDASTKLELQAQSMDASELQRCRFTKEGKPEQAGCYAEAILKSLDLLYASITTCEIFRRADAAWLAFSETVASPDARRKFWKTQAPACTSSATTCAALGGCYHEKYRLHLKGEALAWFPKDSASGKCRLR